MKKLSNFKLNRNGFTLVELIVVIAIIGILVTIVIVAIDPAKQIKNAQDARIRSDLQAMKTAWQLYYNDNKSYPIGASGVPSISYYTAGGCWSSAASCGGTVYMKQVPQDPRGSSFAYPYYYTGLNGQATCSIAPCTDYVVSADLYTQATDDTNTVTKCTGSGTPIPNTQVGGKYVYTFEVCND